MPEPDPATYVAALVDAADRPAGIGVVVGDGQVVTCAHVELTTFVAFPGGSAALFADGSYALEGDPGDELWWAIKLCRFAPGELDPYVPGLRNRLKEP